jgi:hypothetical protein
MSFTLNFSPTLATNANIVVSGCTFTTSDNGLTYTTSDTPSSLNGFNSFYWSSFLVSVTNIPSSVTSIDNYAFYNNCTSLSFLTFNNINNITYIGISSFYNSAITSFTISKNVTNISDQAFQNCVYLNTVTFNTPSSLTTFGTAVFRGCTSLTTITIPNSVTTLSDQLFYECSGLSSINIPSNVTSIGTYSFYNCSSLSSVNIPNNVTSIGISCFQSCTGLNSVVISSSLNNISDQVFQNCNNLNTATFNTPSSITSIGNYSFQNTSLITITIPNSVTSIGNVCFSGCTNLGSITFTSPTSINTLGQYCFYNSGLTSITIPSSLTTIGDYAFQLCGSLTSITIPSSVTSIGLLGFQGIPNLSSTRVYTNIPPSASYAYTYFHTEPDFTNYYSNITFSDPVCFNEGTKILCLNKNFEEEYISIEKLRKGDLVKSYKHGYRKIDLIGKNAMLNDPCIWSNCMYKMKKNDNNGLIEDLIVTGGHSILVDDLLEYKEKNDEMFGGKSQMIDDKYLL